MADNASSPTHEGGAEQTGEEADANAKPDPQFELSPSERAKVRDSLPPRAQVLHETIRKQGTVELERNAAALGWSSLAAGLSMGFSALVPAILNVHLAEGPSRFLIATLGYAVGFLIVILARQQLFTENTMTAVLPMMTKPSASAFRQLLRLWGIVLIGNLLGVSVFALGLLYGRVLEPAVHDAMLTLAQHILANTPWQMFAKGVVAGWLIATMVWLVPAADNAKVPIIVLMTYLIGLGGFTHIIAGSTEVLFAVFDGRVPWHDYVLLFGLPTLAGNIVGGSLIFALISHAQVRSDDA